MPHLLVEVVTPKGIPAITTSPNGVRVRQVVPQGQQCEVHAHLAQVMQHRGLVRIVGQSKTQARAIKGITKAAKKKAEKKSRRKAPPAPQPAE